MRFSLYLLLSSFCDVMWCGGDQCFDEMLWYGVYWEGGLFSFLSAGKMVLGEFLHGGATCILHLSFFPLSIFFVCLFGGLVWVWDWGWGNRVVIAIIDSRVGWSGHCGIFRLLLGVGGKGSSSFF